MAALITVCSNQAGIVSLSIISHFVQEYVAMELSFLMKYATTGTLTELGVLLIVREMRLGTLVLEVLQLHLLFAMKLAVITF